MKNSIILFDSILDILPIKDAKIITFVGAGGKTTLMERLAKACDSRGQKVLLTTTTHILKPTDLPGFIPVTSEDDELLRNYFSQGKSVCLGIPCGIFHGKEKWQSPSNSFLQAIKSCPDLILCEGDGSKRLPVKMPREHEPVFFPGTDTVFGVIGLSCLGRPLSKVMYGLEENYPLLKQYFPHMNTNTSVDIKLLQFLVLSSCGIFKGCDLMDCHIIFNQADALPKKNLDSVRELVSHLKSRNISCHILSLKEQFKIVV